jgi:hypothetical protein
MAAQVEPETGRLTRRHGRSRAGQHSHARDGSIGTGHRCERVVELIEAVSKHALKRNIRVKSFSRAKIKQAFAESAAPNKYEIAIAIAKRFPVLQPRLPRFRKPCDE